MKRVANSVFPGYFDRVHAGNVRVPGNARREEKTAGWGRCWRSRPSGSPLVVLLHAFGKGIHHGFGFVWGVKISKVDESVSLVD